MAPSTYRTSGRGCRAELQSIHSSFTIAAECMVEHLVLFRFGRHVVSEEIAALFGDLRRLAQDIEGITRFRGGAYTSPEGLNQGWTHGFVMTFSSEAARNVYLTHPAHQQVVDKLLPLLEGGIQGALAFDLIDGAL